MRCHSESRKRLRPTARPASPSAANPAQASSDAADPAGTAQAYTRSKPSARSSISAPVSSRRPKPRRRMGAVTAMPTSTAVLAGRSNRNAAAATGGADGGSVTSLSTSTARWRIRPATSWGSRGTSRSKFTACRSQLGTARRISSGGARGARSGVSTRPCSPAPLGRDLAATWGGRPSHRPGEGQVTALTLVLTRPARPARSERTRL
jgi:hypothetical protein